MQRFKRGQNHPQRSRDTCAEKPEKVQTHLQSCLVFKLMGHWPTSTAIRLQSCLPGTFPRLANLRKNARHEKQTFDP